MDCLLKELQKLADSETCNIASVVLILDEVAAQMSLQPLDCDLTIFVPDTHGSLRQITDMYYDDSIGMRVSPPETVFPAHPRISKLTAATLRIPFLSSLQLGNDGNDDLFDDEDMSEDLATRVSGVLKEYDMQYALNEFLANAIDAGATKFDILIDEKSFDTATIISPEMKPMQQSPALVLYNNAVFQPEDLRGLRRIGRGGKGHVSDTIGRYGLGALSLFHFTEVWFQFYKFLFIPLIFE
jgi:hypothetical protein